VHLIRKGAATFCFNGTTSGVSITAAVYIRAGCTLGNVQDRYIQLVIAGDQVCGRTLVGLDVFSHDYVIFPPHRIFSNTGLDSKDDTSSETTEEETFRLSEIKEVIRCVFGDIPTEWDLLARYLKNKNTAKITQKLRKTKNPIFALVYTRIEPQARPLH
jgi:hypothetical protein